MQKLVACVAQAGIAPARRGRSRHKAGKLVAALLAAAAAAAWAVYYCLDSWITLPLV